MTKKILERKDIPFIEGFLYEGMTFGEIAEAIGVSNGTLCLFVKEHNLKRPEFWSLARHSADVVEEMIVCGFSENEISRVTGHDKSSIRAFGSFIGKIVKKKKKRRTDLTSLDVTEMVRLHRTGKNLTEIGKMYGVSYQSVWIKIKDRADYQGWGTRSKIYQRLYRAGYSIETIARRMNVKTGSVRDSLRRSGESVSAKKRKSSISGKSKSILLMFRNGRNMSYIARQLGVDRRTVVRFLRKKGLRDERKGRGAENVDES